ncbi:hypothetical protein DSO57_1034779 [Entomophthora muscae]|uniref:Uncharacterized protein n=1 Tax=Entomophthora muscae TaxID=34485 RepID=A0ACC2UJK1_9FUNG|nr:hypothetical protein DSO57_1034779 [Entomophthora muscae]
MGQSHPKSWSNEKKMTESLISKHQGHPSKVPHKRPHTTQTNIPITQNQMQKSTQISKTGNKN